MNNLKHSILVLLLLLSVQLYAQGGTRNVTKERKVEEQLAAIDPSLLKPFKAATIAMDENKLNLADSLFSVVLSKAPTFDPALRRLGGIRIELGKREEGLALCEKAVKVNRSAYNLLSLASSYYRLAFADSVNKEDYFSKALVLLREAENLSNGKESDFYMLRGEIALQTNNVDEFRIVTKALSDLYPNEMVTHYYGALLAATDEEWTKAEKEILIAQKMGLPLEDVNALLDSGVRTNANAWRYAMYFLWVVAFWALGILLLFLIGKFLSNFTIRTLEESNNGDKKGGFERLLKAVYRSLISIGGVYYYISLPIILILVVALVIGLFYGFLLVGRIPIQLMLVLVVGAGVSIYGMVRSLLVRVKYSDPGRELNENEAPGLFKIANEVADAIGTRPIDEIRITSSTDLAVYERGSWREKLQDKSTRILILGVGVLKEFKQNEFKAVLAHEYGHFSHRDTAGGEVALRVRNDMSKYFYSLYSAGQNVWWNIAFQFLRLYNTIYIRISHGATRLQEVLADRVAAQTYGATAFQNGLTYVIKRDLEFTKLANSEIEDAEQKGRAFNNLYELSGNFSNEIEEELAEVLSRKTSEEDTHPSAVDRFRYVSGINAKVQVDDESYIRELFLDWESITLEMTSFIEQRVRANS